ncbi:LON peptidase N-terminal domain and RING finger protein 1-like [Gastrophryne carolinensis]
MELLSCPKCQLPLWEPVTVACGHTFCRGCLLGSAGKQCHVCQWRLVGTLQLGSNTLLAALIDKFLDPHSKTRCIARDLRSLVTDGQDEEAAKLASKAAAMAPQDIALRVLCCEVYLHLQKLPEALREAEVICDLQPRSPGGFYRKGTAFMHMGKKTEALLQFQHCLTLNPQFSEAQERIEELLKDSGRPVPSSLEDLLNEVSQYLKLSPDTSAPLPPIQTSNTDVKLYEDKTIFSNPGELILDQEQKKRKAQIEPAPPDKGRISKHFKVTDSQEEDDKQLIKPNPFLKDLLNPSDVECSLCIRILLDPVTTPCGHTFCKGCLLRSMDHRPYCPLCKQSLQEYLRVAHYAVTGILVDLMAAIFPLEIAERKQFHLSEIAELSNLVSNVPIFVCTISFPGVPCPLHVFEPRYRLMMRRCLETGTKSFGMCVYESGKSFADYGCMLEILHLDYLPDGRSLVETVGRRRFRVLQRGHLDGYHTAEVEYLADKKVEGEELEELQRLHDIVYQQLEECFSQPRGSLARRILLHQSGPPLKEDNIQASPDGPFWCWWLLSVLPLDPTYQTRILSMTSLKERLFHLKHILSVFVQSRS